MPYQLKITLQDVTPPIWRRVVVGELTLLELHHVIQIAMGWEDGHLHDFTIKGQRYSLPDYDLDESFDESSTMLRDVLRPRLKFVYQYDFGDGWNHVVQVEKATPDTAIVTPECIGGARACPPEDSGGPWGYLQKLEAVSGPDDDDDETEELREWMGDFDPESFDLDTVNKRLAAFHDHTLAGQGR
jgi:hypothetical protein